MSDINCPYCGFDQEINHDDGYGYNEDESFEQECVSCDKTFKFTVHISFLYSAYCQPEDHKMEPCGDRWPKLWECTVCEHHEHREVSEALEVE